MGKADLVARKFMSDPKNFADSFNLAFQVYGYKRMSVNANTLKALDTNHTQSMFGKILERFSDVFKAGQLFYDNKYCYMALLIENQHYVHPGMPLKLLSYIMLDLIQQVKDYQALHPNKKRTSDEFLSNFPIDFQLRPILPLVIYFGPQAWTAPKDLADMFQYVPRRLRWLLPHQKYLVLSPTAINDKLFQDNKSEFSLALQAMKHAQTRSTLSGFFKNNDDYAKVSSSLAEMIAANVNCNLDNITLKESNNMYEISHFWDESDERLRNEGFKRGDKHGFKRGDKHGRIGILVDLVKDGLLTQQAAAERANMSESEFSKLCQSSVKTER